MPLIVEDGSGMATAESYVSVATCAAYATDRGLSFPTANQANCEAALRRATAYIDARYRAGFSGQRVKFRDQALEWPRANAYDAAEHPISAYSVPPEVVAATCEAAIRELAVPNCLSPDQARSAKRYKAGSVEVEYWSPDQSTDYQAIDRALSNVLGAASGSGVTGTAVRG